MRFYPIQVGSLMGVSFALDEWEGDTVVIPHHWGPTPVLWGTRDKRAAVLATHGGNIEPQDMITLLRSIFRGGRLAWLNRWLNAEGGAQ